MDDLLECAANVDSSSALKHLGPVVLVWGGIEDVEAAAFFPSGFKHVYRPRLDAIWIIIRIKHYGDDYDGGGGGDNYDGEAGIDTWHQI